MITPDQFRVNEAWIAVRINERFLFIQDEPYDVYVLVDAASCYVLGHVLFRVVDEAPQEKDLKELFQTAFEAKNQWADMLILTGNSPADDAFKNQGQQKGLSAKTVDPSELEPILGPLKESFASDFMRGSS
ncbi:hypothetical protein ACJ77P_02545 [Syntrophus buswellii]|jgi:hypothetical protein|uniref:hypothetical protein n=1 Tax=Syntrophus TaxID=43773 RepID=UPI00345E2287